MLGIKDSNPKIDDIVSILKNKSESRITSYNVCYTKLLRNNQPSDWEDYDCVKLTVEYLRYVAGDEDADIV